MTTRRRIAAGALGALILFLPTLGHSQTGTWELSVHGGALRHEVLGSESGNDPLIGARFERWSEAGWGVNGNLDWVGVGERSLVGFEEPTRVDGRLLRYSLAVDRSFALGERAGIALGTGIGAATAWYDVNIPGMASRDESETNLLVPVSGRVTVMNAARSWGLALGIRDDIVFLDERDPLGGERNGVAHQVQGTIGLSMFFGKPGRAPERARAATPDELAASMPEEGEARMARDRALAEIGRPIYFDFDRSELKAPSRETLQLKADVLQEWPATRVVIEGHADERGTVEYNLALGERRAQGARQYLIDLGIDGDRLSTVSYGEERPAAEGPAWPLDDPCRGRGYLLPNPDPGAQDRTGRANRASPVRSSSGQRSPSHPFPEANRGTTGRAGILALLLLFGCDGSGGPTSTLPPGPTGGYTALALGIRHACGTYGEATWCWGRNAAGELGNGSVTGSLRPVRVAGDALFESLALGPGHSCGLTPTGAAFCWGSGARGALGTGEAIDRRTPTPVAGANAFHALAAGSAFTCGIDAASVGWCWGANGAGQLGNGTNLDRFGPAPVALGRSLRAVAAGAAHACAVDGSGAAWCWGANGHGQLGDGTTTASLLPVAVAGGHAFVAITAGTSHTCALSADGAAWCWGENVVGQLGQGLIGTGTEINRTTPVHVAAPVGLVQVAAGAGHTCALGIQGSAYCWGWNVDGQIGDGVLGDRAAPARVPAPQPFVRIAAGLAASCGIAADGRAWCWGRNDDGELGDGQGINRRFPSPVGTP